MDTMGRERFGAGKDLVGRPRGVAVVYFVGVGTEVNMVGSVDPGGLLVFQLGT